MANETPTSVVIIDSQKVKSPKCGESEWYNSNRGHRCFTSELGPSERARHPQIQKDGWTVSTGLLPYLGETGVPTLVTQVAHSEVVGEETMRSYSGLHSEAEIVLLGMVALSNRVDGNVAKV